MVVGFGSICDEAPVGRQRWVEFVPGRVRESPQVGAVGVDDPHVVVVREDDPPGDGAKVEGVAAPSGELAVMAADSVASPLDGALTTEGDATG
jgi:hypothetical protein